jgi:Uma2 family endonuclease
MGTEAVLATVADLEQRTDRTELINGVIVTMTPASFAHARITLTIGSMIRDYVRGNGLEGEVLAGDPGFIWDEHNVRAPDVAYLPADQVRKAPATGFMPFSPAMAVEVVSPSDRWTEVRIKVRGWLAHGTRLVWIIDPHDRTVEVMAPDADPRDLGMADTIDGGDVLPGLALRVADIFA